MKQKLIYILLTGYLLFALLSFGLVHYYSASRMNQAMEKNEAEDLYAEAVSLATNYGYRFYSNTITKESLTDYLDVYASFLNADIWVVSSEGQVDAVVKSSHALTPRAMEGFDITTMFDSGYYEIGTFHSYFTEDYLSVYAPVTVNYKVMGYVMIHEPLKNIHEDSLEASDILCQTILGIIAVSSVTLLITGFFIIKPINRMCDVAKEYTNDNFKPQIHLKAPEELSFLADTMNYMSTKLDTHEDEQRKFISNISHDFRSPLTSIRGYIQAMLDGTIPPELYEKYLLIISNEADRLTKLTNNMLDLNRIGSRDAKLELTDLDINRVVLECAQSMEVQCKEKGISISLILCGDSLFVHADYLKIQQVIYNLMDNAVKFSRPDTTITLETSCKNEKAYVSIKDQGIGIPKDSLENIWTRFYKSDLSRGKDKKGTGLGLSIVKEIIQAHDETIHVTSTEGVGSEFVFSLQLAERELE